MNKIPLRDIETGLPIITCSNCIRGLSNLKRYGENKILCRTCLYSTRISLSTKMVDGISLRKYSQKFEYKNFKLAPHIPLMIETFLKKEEFQL